MQLTRQLNKQFILCEQGCDRPCPEDGTCLCSIKDCNGLSFRTRQA